MMVGSPVVTSNGSFIAYYRVSTAKQGASGLGLDAQRKAVGDYLNGGRWKIVGEFTEVESGRNASRPQLDAALKAARVHRCPLVVAKVDRLTRSVSFLSRLLDTGVDVRFADLPQIEGPTGQFMLTQMAAVAQLEAGLISSRTKAALAAAKQRGKKLGGARSTKLSTEARAKGNDRNRQIAKVLAADLATVIDDIRKEGATSLRDIAAQLEARKIPTARGSVNWSAVQVQRVLDRIA